jgi:hypothetical protein
MRRMTPRDLSFNDKVALVTTGKLQRIGLAQKLGLV